MQRGTQLMYISQDSSCLTVSKSGEIDVCRFLLFIPPVDLNPFQTRIGDPREHSPPDPTQLGTGKTSALPRQRGCDAYEALSGVEKLDVGLTLLNLRLLGR